MDGENVGEREVFAWAAEGYLEAVRAELATIPVTRGLEVVPAALGRYAGVIGAADLALEARRGE